MKKQLKPALTYDEQIALLKSRGLIVHDEAIARMTLSKISYYRLVGGYSLGFYTDSTKSKYITGFSFEKLLCIYTLDCKLRNLISPLIETVEIHLRTKLAYYLAFIDPLSYMDSNNFQNKNYHDSFLTYFNNEKARQSHQPLIKHHNKNYGGQLPIWAATEIISFGELSKLFTNLNPLHGEVISKELSLHNKYPIAFNRLQSWIPSLVEVRNICAHFGRLYNKNLKRPPSLYNEYSHLNRKFFGTLLILKSLLYNKTEFDNFFSQLSSLLEDYKEVDFSGLGFPTNWHEILNK